MIIFKQAHFFINSQSINRTIMDQYCSPQCDKQRADLIVLMVDASGSMAGPGHKMVMSGVGAFISECASSDIIHAHSFNDKIESVFAGKAGDQNVLMERLREMRCGGKTALHDSLFRLASRLNSKIQVRSEAESSQKITLVIISDGCDNASKKHSASECAAAVRELQSSPGTSVFFIGMSPCAGGNCDSASIGVPHTNTMNVDPMQVPQAMRSVSESITRGSPLKLLQFRDASGVWCPSPVSAATSIDIQKKFPFPPKLQRTMSIGTSTTENLSMVQKNAFAHHKMHSRDAQTALFDLEYADYSDEYYSDE